MSPESAGELRSHQSLSAEAPGRFSNLRRIRSGSSGVWRWRLRGQELRLQKCQLAALPRAFRALLLVG